MIDDAPHLLNSLDTALDCWVVQHGLPRFRSQQVRRWLFQQRATTWDEMTDLPQSLRHELAQEMRLWSTQISRHTQADDGTEKLLLKLSDGGQIECVLLRERFRRTICISTQVGCGMGCVFCASGLDGVERNLTGEDLASETMLVLRSGKKKYALLRFSP